MPTRTSTKSGTLPHHFSLVAKRMVAVVHKRAWIHRTRDHHTIPPNPPTVGRTTIACVQNPSAVHPAYPATVYRTHTGGGGFLTRIQSARDAIATRVGMQTSQMRTARSMSLMLSFVDQF